MRATFRIFGLASLLLLAGPAIAGGYITGTISDIKLTPLPGADIWVFDAVTAELVAELQTDDSGYFATTSLAAGDYKIRVKLTVLKDNKCRVVFKEFLGPEIKPGVFEHSDVFDTAASFAIHDNDTTQIARPLRENRCPVIAQCVMKPVGIAGAVTNLDGEPLNGIVVRAKEAITAMPVFETVSGPDSSTIDGEYIWKRNTCGGLPDVKIRFVDPSGAYSSEYWQEQPDDFSLGAAVDVTPPVKLAIVTLERVSLPQQIAAVAGTVESLPLDPNTEAQMIHVLDQASTKLTDENPNNDKSTCGLLKGFINHLNGVVSSGELTVEEGALLAESVESIREGLGCKN